MKSTPDAMLEACKEMRNFFKNQDLPNSVLEEMAKELYEKAIKAISEVKSESKT